jgi:iron complex outermembrane receptor protein
VHLGPWLVRCAISFIVLAITAGAGSPAGAQGTSGTIAGTVLDPSGAAVPGATVTVTSGTTEAGTAVTDAAGSYTVHNLAAGAYRVEVQLQGFERFVRADVQVQVGAATRVDAALEVDVAMLEEVVVTARRREEHLQDTPVAISLFTAATLEARQIQQTQDLERITPSLQFKPAGQLSGNTAASVVFIRGVGQLDPTAAVDPGVGIYIDEVYVGRAVGGLIDFGDIAGVEVLRGPQGTLFGRNTIGGAILVRTRTPEIGKFSSKVRFRLGPDGLYDGFAGVNLPIGDTAAARLSGAFRKREGYVTRALDGRDLGNDDSYSFNGGFAWVPSRKSLFFLRADYTRRDENGAPFVFAGINETAPVPAIVSVAARCPGATMPFLPAGDPRLGPPNVPSIDDPRCANDFQAQGDFTSGGTAPVVSTSQVWGLAGTATVHLTERVSLKSITAYRSTDSQGVRDADSTPFAILATDLTTDSRQFSEEVQLQLDGDRLGAIVGGYYFNEATDERASVPLSFPPAPPIIASILAGGPGSRDLQYSDLETNSLAAFGHVSFKPARGLEVAAGLRYTDDRKAYRGTVMNLFPGTQPDPDPLPTLAIPEGGPLFIFNRRFEDTYAALTGSASVQYRWNPSLSTYASYARSFKSGGFNTRYNAAPPNYVPVPFDEEKVDGYEVGAKIGVGGNFRLNVAAFQADYQDMQLIFRQGVVPLLFNAGNATIRGFESELHYRPTARLIVQGGFSTLSDQIKSITTIPGAAATVAPGDDLPLTPAFQGNLGVSVPVALSNRFTLTPHIDTTYTSKLTFITGSVPIIEQDGYAVVNASLTLAESKRGWQLTTGVQNLLDERYLIQGNASLATLGYAERIVARPRNWFVQFSVDF